MTAFRETEPQNISRGVVFHHTRAANLYPHSPSLTAKQTPQRTTFSPLKGRPPRVYESRTETKNHIRDLFADGGELRYRYEPGYVWNPRFESVRCD